MFLKCLLFLFRIKWVLLISKPRFSTSRQETNTHMYHMHFFLFYLNQHGKDSILSINVVQQDYCNLIVLITQISSPIFSATQPEISTHIFLSRNEMTQTLFTSTDTCNLPVSSTCTSMGNPYLTLDLEICLVVNLISMKTS